MHNNHVLPHKDNVRHYAAVCITHCTISCTWTLQTGRHSNCIQMGET